MIAMADSKLYKHYPLSALFIYNGVTLVHFSLGAAGIVIAYDRLTAAWMIAAAYLAFALVEMYVVMPLKVCPSCVYYRMDDSLCVSGMNVVSKRFAGKRPVSDFPLRAEGLLCHNNMYMGSLFAPLLAMLPALFFNFTPLLLVIFLAVLALLLFRFFVIFPKVACVHCYAKNRCPNAIKMGMAEGNKAA
jgi:hypothetical protein